jgi:hypothetical protein
MEWRLVCPRWSGELHRVFPGLGHRRAWPLPRTGGGGALLYWNFRSRFWVPALRKLGLPVLTPHSAGTPSFRPCRPKELKWGWWRSSPATREPWSPSGTTRRPSGARRARSRRLSGPSQRRNGERTGTAQSATYGIYDSLGKLVGARVCRPSGRTNRVPEEIEREVEEFGLCDNEAYVSVGMGRAIFGIGLADRLTSDGTPWEGPVPIADSPLPTTPEESARMQIENGVIRCRCC